VVGAGASNAADRASASTTAKEGSASNAAGRASASTTHKKQLQAMRRGEHLRAHPHEVEVQGLPAEDGLVLMDTLAHTAPIVYFLSIACHH
jgi:hypothetical protein